MALLFFLTTVFFFLSSNRFLTCLILQFTIYIFSIYIFSFTIYIFSICTPILLIPPFSNFSFYPILYFPSLFVFSLFMSKPSSIPRVFPPNAEFETTMGPNGRDLIFFSPACVPLTFRVPRSACRVSRVTCHALHYVFCT